MKNLIHFLLPLLFAFGICNISIAQENDSASLTNAQLQQLSKIVVNNGQPVSVRLVEAKTKDPSSTTANGQATASIKTINGKALAPQNNVFVYTIKDSKSKVVKTKKLPNQEVTQSQHQALNNLFGMPTTIKTKEKNGGN